MDEEKKCESDREEEYTKRQIFIKSRRQNKTRKWINEEKAQCVWRKKRHRVRKERKNRERERVEECKDRNDMQRNKGTNRQHRHTEKKQQDTEREKKKGNARGNLICVRLKRQWPVSNE